MFKLFIQCSTFLTYLLSFKFCFVSFSSVLPFLLLFYHCYYCFTFYLCCIFLTSVLLLTYVLPFLHLFYLLYIRFTLSLCSILKYICSTFFLQFSYIFTFVLHLFFTFFLHFLPLFYIFLPLFYLSLHFVYHCVYLPKKFHVVHLTLPKTKRGQILLLLFLIYIRTVKHSQYICLCLYVLTEKWPN